MASVEERLKLKRGQVDTWSTREKLCLASSVARSGNQNWMSVSRSLKAFGGEPGRPGDWFSQKSCAAQYDCLLTHTETPKRKKRGADGTKSDGPDLAPADVIVRQLTTERIEELRKLMAETRALYAKEKEELYLVENGQADDKLNEMLLQIQEEKKLKEREHEEHLRWLRQREERKQELEMACRTYTAQQQYRGTATQGITPASTAAQSAQVARRPSNQSEISSEADSNVDSPLSSDQQVGAEDTVEAKPAPTPTSPLLTSLLKSPSAASAAQSTSILHSAITSQRGASPTITSLLNSSPSIPSAAASSLPTSPNLKSLVSSALAGLEDVPKPLTHSSSGSPTLSMLLELPPSTPGQPLPELPYSVSKQPANTNTTTIAAGAELNNVMLVPSSSANTVESVENPISAPEESPIEQLIMVEVPGDVPPVVSADVSQIPVSDQTILNTSVLAMPGLESVAEAVHGGSQSVGAPVVEATLLEVPSIEGSNSWVSTQVLQSVPKTVPFPEELSNGPIVTGTPPAAGATAPELDLPSVATTSTQLAPGPSLVPDAIKTEPLQNITNVEIVLPEETEANIADAESKLNLDDADLQHLSSADLELVMDPMDVVLEELVPESLVEEMAVLIEVSTEEVETSVNNMLEMGVGAASITAEKPTAQPEETKEVVNEDHCKKELDEQQTEKQAPNKVQEPVLDEKQEQEEKQGQLVPVLEQPQLEIEDASQPEAEPTLEQVEQVCVQSGKDIEQVQEQVQIQEEFKQEPEQVQEEECAVEQEEGDTQEINQPPTQPDAESVVPSTPPQPAAQQQAPYTPVTPSSSVSSAPRSVSQLIKGSKVGRKINMEEEDLEPKENADVVLKKEDVLELNQDTAEGLSREALESANIVIMQDNGEVVKLSDSGETDKVVSDIQIIQDAPRNGVVVLPLDEAINSEGGKELEQIVQNVSEQGEEAPTQTIQSEVKIELDGKIASPKRETHCHDVKTPVRTVRRSSKEPGSANKEHRLTDDTSDSDKEKSVRKDVEVSEREPDKDIMSVTTDAAEKSLTKNDPTPQKINDPGKGVENQTDSSRPKESTKKRKSLSLPKRDKSPVVSESSNDVTSEEDLKRDSVKEEKKTIDVAKDKSSAEKENRVAKDKSAEKENRVVSHVDDDSSRSADQDSNPPPVKEEKTVRAETPSTEDDNTRDTEPPVPQTQKPRRGRLGRDSSAHTDSVPNSPASTVQSTDDEKEFRAWKKSIMLVYGRIAAHKYASIFLRPITDDKAPGYSQMVYRPIDLFTIKKNIENGTIRTTDEFQRDILLMFNNAIMYNKTGTHVHTMAQEMQAEGVSHLKEYVNTQLLVQAVGAEGGHRSHLPSRRGTRTAEKRDQESDGSSMRRGGVDKSSTPRGGTPVQPGKRKRSIVSDDRATPKRRKGDDL